MTLPAEPELAYALPNSADPYAAKRAEIDAALAKFMEGVDVHGAREALDDDTAARANDYIAGLKQLAREAEDARVAEKAPHLAAGRAVDASWDAIKDRIARLINVVKPKLDAFLMAKQEAQRKVAEEAERRRREAEEATRAAAAEAAAATTASARIEAEAREEAAARIANEATADIARASEPVRVESATGLANRRGMRTVYRARIVSLPQALSHYAKHREMEALILRLAQADLRAAPTVRGEKTIPRIPGIEFAESKELNA